MSFRHLSPTDVVRAACAAELALIEWGSDVHAPPHDANLTTVAGATQASGLVTSSYGTYWRAGSSTAADIAPLIAAASQLRAPRVRIWTEAGAEGTDPRIVSDVQRFADAAGEAGLDVALEFHEGTACDSAERVLALLDAVDRPNVGSYWQPLEGKSPPEALLADLSMLVDRLSAMHVFACESSGRLTPLESRADLWLPALRMASAAQPHIDLLLEFVPGDDPTLLASEAAVVRRWIDAIEAEGAGSQEISASDGIDNQVRNSLRHASRCAG